MNTQYSRISHHSISGTGATFSIPTQEDFTTGWNSTGIELVNKEFGINTTDNKAYLRIGSTINEVSFVPTTDYIPHYLTLTTTTNAVITAVTVSVATSSSTIVSFKVSGYDTGTDKQLVTSQEAHLKVGTASISLGTNTFYLTNDFVSGATVTTATGSNFMNIKVTGETGKTILWKILYDVL